MSKDSTVAPERGTPLRVLLVEDSEDDALLVLRALRQGGYDCTWRRVDTVAALRDALAAERWDIVFCDYMMPRLSGPAAVALIRARHLDMPVIMVSGEVGEEFAVTAMKAGANDFVMKSRLSRLLPAVERELHEAETRAARQQAEAALRETQERYQRLVGQLPVGIVVTDAAGQVISANPAALAMLGSPSEEATCHFNVLTLPNLRDTGISDAYARVLRGGAAEQLEGWYTSFWGKRSLLCFEVVPLRDAAGGVNGAITIIQDMTERARAEAALRKSQDDLQALNRELEQRVAERTVQLQAANRELQAFGYSVSHDLMAPLRAIDGFVRMVLEDDAAALSDTSRAHLERVVAGAGRMATLIGHLLELSRVTRAELHRGRVDLSALAHAVAAELRHADPGRCVAFSIAPGVGADADPLLARVVLENLLGNAWKYTSRRPAAHIEFGVVSGTAPPVYVVRDDGAGFDMAHADRLFVAFHRLHDGEEFGGTGVGLATTQRIIERHGGRIWAESAVGQGAAFFFTFASERAAAGA
jgi:PAS domain S-box-containing protein